MRRESGWELSLSRTGLRFSRYSYADDAPAAPMAGRRWWLLPLIAGSGSIAAGVFAAPAAPVEPAYTVSVPVPDARPAMTRAYRTARNGEAGTIRGGQTIKRGTDLRSSEVPADEPALAGAVAQEQRFTAAAMRTGEMQSWRAGEVRYFLIAGDLQPTDQGACRQFSLLARAEGGSDSVRQFERCRSSDPAPVTR